jgi:uncharacterized protein involved in exopolysaccharide biosynthesis
MIGFFVVYTASSPARAQRVCDGVTSLLIAYDAQTQRGDVANDTRRFLAEQVEDAKRKADKLHSRLIASRRNQPVRGAEHQRLAREYKNSQETYLELLQKQKQAEAAKQREMEAASNYLHVLSSATLPESQDFPNRTLFAIWGLAAGLFVGLSLLAIR